VGQGKIGADACKLRRGEQKQITHGKSSCHQ
jgi:hypothetical protein